MTRSVGAADSRTNGAAVGHAAGRPNGGWHRSFGPKPVNTHIHLPPNFSAFDEVADVVRAARREGVVAIGSSNYFDFNVYRRFAALAAEAGIVALHGTEIITLQDDLREAGILVNDPGNPGRTYMCGKALAGFDAPGPVGQALMDAVRGTSERRMAEMEAGLAARARAAGLTDVPTIDEIVLAVAARNDVPPEWVSLQERHLARAFQEAVWAQFEGAARASFLEAFLGGSVDPAVAAHAIALQETIRSKLMKAGRPAFVPEAAISFDDAYRLVLELRGIPCYPTLADGARPICSWEAPATVLAERLLERNVFMAELIPVRNAPEVVDEYVAAFRSAGILVLGGTEHNTQRMIPLAPTCLGGVPLSQASREAFWEATCVVAAHQQHRAAGESGYVDGDGRLAPGFPDAEARIRYFAELGEEVIATVVETGARA